MFCEISLELREITKTKIFAATPAQRAFRKTQTTIALQEPTSLNSYNKCFVNIFLIFRCLILFCCINMRCYIIFLWTAGSECRRLKNRFSAIFRGFFWKFGIGRQCWKTTQWGQTTETSVTEWQCVSDCKTRFNVKVLIYCI